jgi:ribose/xylose/arabinose/galactoside ABC-type transport system permease subunit
MLGRGLTHYGDLVLTAGLASEVLMMQPRRYRTQLLPCMLTAIATYLVLLVGNNQPLVSEGLIVALTAVLAAILFREWPQCHTGVAVCLMAGIGTGVGAHKYFIAILIATVGTLVLRITLWFSRQHQQPK